MMTPKDYTTKEINVKLTRAEIDLIIEELLRTEHNLFEFLGYAKLIGKLRGEKT